MQKAKSRLDYPAKAVGPSIPPRGMLGGRQKTKNNSLLKKYFKHLPALILAIIFYLITFYFLQNVYPEQIKNFLIPNSYLPLQIILLLANFFLFSFLLLKSRRGLLISLFLASCLYLQLGFEYPKFYLLILLAWFLGLEILFSIIDRV